MGEQQIGSARALFEQSSRLARGARFVLAEIDIEGDSLAVSAQFFEVATERAVARVLFFRNRTDRTTVSLARATVLVNRDLLAQTQELIAARTKDYSDKIRIVAG